MEELFRYYLRNIIILRIGTGLRYLWLRFVRHRKISYRTLYEGSKSKKTSELSNFENEMSNRAWGCGFILFCDILNYIFTQIFIIDIQKNDYATDIVYRNTSRCHCFRFGVQVEEKDRKQNGQYEP